MPIYNTTPRANFEIHRGAPNPIEFVQTDDTGAYVQFDSTLTFSAETSTGVSISKSVGSGITLSIYDSTANAKVSIQLSTAESETIPLGLNTDYEIVKGSAGSERGVMIGKLNGVGELYV
jgi:hypothetical protein